MRLNGIRCDTCCKEHLFDSSLQFPSIHMVLPDSWFMLSQGNFDPGKELLMFCSVDCLSQWAGKQVAIDREAKQSPEYKERLNEIAEVQRLEDLYGKW